MFILVLWIIKYESNFISMIVDKYHHQGHFQGQLLDHNERREFQYRGGEHPHGTLHVEGAPVFDKDSDQKVVKFIDKYITCAIPDKKEYPELHKLVTTVQTHGHTQTCKKKKGIKCRFNFPAPPSDTTRIVRLEVTDCDDNFIKEKRKIVDSVFFSPPKIGER